MRSGRKSGIDQKSKGGSPGIQYLGSFTLFEDTCDASGLEMSKLDALNTLTFRVQEQLRYKLSILTDTMSLTLSV